MILLLWSDTLKGSFKGYFQQTDRFHFGKIEAGDFKVRRNIVKKKPFSYSHSEILNLHNKFSQKMY